jgi:hypothetical protein
MASSQSRASSWWRTGRRPRPRLLKGASWAKSRRLPVGGSGLCYGGRCGMPPRLPLKDETGKRARSLCIQGDSQPRESQRCSAGEGKSSQAFVMGPTGP